MTCQASSCALISETLLDTPSALRAQPTAPVAARDSSKPWTMRDVFGAHRYRIMLTYGLFNLENLLRIAQPWALGLAIKELLHSSYWGLIVFCIQHVAYTLLSAGRRVYDTRTFSRISTDVATRLVLDQRTNSVNLSRVTARSALSREIVTFFEHMLPFVVDIAYSVIGALVMLAMYDWVLVPASLVLLLPVSILGYSFGRTALRINRQMNDELEREVDVIQHASPEDVRGHYSRVRNWRMCLTDRAALNFTLMELCAFGLMAITLIRCCSSQTLEPGKILSVFGYILIFARNLSSVPMLIEQGSRLRDICRRMNCKE